MIATNIEQSKRLLELGLDPKTADMCYEPYMSKNGDIDITDLMLCLTPYMLNSHISFPAWSLTALFEVMPKSFKRWCLISNMKDYYWCTFEQNDGFIIKEFYAENPVIAAYQMVCWLLEQGLIKKGDNDEQ